MVGWGTFVLILELVCLIHVIKTGRPFWWLFAVVFVPIIGPVVYFFMEVLPDLMRSGPVTGTTMSVAKIMNPSRDLLHLREELAICDTVQNRQALADEAMRCGLYEEAISLYKSCLTGLYQDDPAIMQSLAQAYYHNKSYDDAKKTLDDLIRVNPSYRSGEARLLMARTLEELNEAETALEDYSSAVKSFLGEEARCRYALFLKKMGNVEKANALFNQIITNWNRAPNHVRKAQREWYNIACQNLKQQQ